MVSIFYFLVDLKLKSQFVKIPRHSKVRLHIRSSLCLSYYLTGYKIRYKGETMARMCAKSLLLVFGIVLGLSHLSSCQSWKVFQEKHIVDTPSIDCSHVMNNSLFIIRGHCKKLNTFIVSPAATVQAICSRVPGHSNVLSSTIFQLINCIRRSDVTPPCPYNSEKKKNKICVTCESRVPVHFVGVGKC
ncbi:oocytes ribonuclease-like [Aquarana catesbeiana]|uniref:oocytes ribonuclease-like n=1 Tax=Aquarana catesbeiana TaxID=8400 RepID=UPI003CCA5AED